MNDVAFGALILRMLVSLAIVLGLILVAYVIVKRRRGGSSMSSTGKTSMVGSFVAGRVGKASGTGRRPARSGAPKRGLQTLGRIGLSRTSNVHALQFADRVYLLGTSDSDAPSVLAEITLEAWLEAIEPSDDLDGPGSVAKGIVGRPMESDRPGLLDALRDRTTRRG
jgi:hypothetical protein